MRIKKIIIENFKSIDHLEITDLSNLNIFIGKNDAGKSNILDAIDIIFNADLQTHFPELVLEEKNLIAKRYKGDLSLILHDRLKDYFDISLHLELSTIELKKLNLSKVLEKANFSGYESGHELVIKRRISTDSKSNKTRCNLDFVSLDRIMLVKPSYEKQRVLYYTDKSIEFKDFDVKKKGLVIETFLKNLGNHFEFIPAERNIIRDPMPASQKTKAEGFIKTSLINLANSEDRDKRLMFQQFTSFINRMSTLIEKVVQVKRGNKVVDVRFETNEGVEIPLTSIGGGNYELLLLMHALIMSGGSIIAIEEPEIHLHPEAQRKLFDMVAEFSKASQIILITHSSVFVDPKIIRGLYRVIKKDEKTFVYGMAEQDFVNVDRLEQELNAENCEMFFADKVLLVEGISDKMFMEILMGKFSKSTEEIKVVSSYSKDNFTVYVALLKIFHIPYMIMTDLDSIKGRFWPKVIYEELKKARKKIQSRNERIAYLKTKNIFVLSKGALEQSYPVRYRRGQTKPLDALYAAHNITKDEYNSNRMKDIKEVIEAL